MSPDQRARLRELLGEALQRSLLGIPSECEYRINAALALLDAEPEEPQQAAPSEPDWFAVLLEGAKRTGADKKLSVHNLRHMAEAVHEAAPLAPCRHLSTHLDDGVRYCDACGWHVPPTTHAAMEADDE